MSLSEDFAVGYSSLTMHAVTLIAGGFVAVCLLTANFALIDASSVYRQFVDRHYLLAAALDLFWVAVGLWVKMSLYARYQRSRSAYETGQIG